MTENHSGGVLEFLSPGTQAAGDSAVPTANLSGSSIKLGDLGPMVVNSDGTLSRIANWANMTNEERARTLRVLSARNKIRLANEAKKLQEIAVPPTSEDQADNNNTAK